MLIVTPIVGLCNGSMFCCVLLYVHYSFTIILMGKRELVALLCLSSWCLVIVVWLFLTMQRVCLQFVIVIFPDHTHLLLRQKASNKLQCTYNGDFKLRSFFKKNASSRAKSYGTLDVIKLCSLICMLLVDDVIL